MVERSNKAAVRKGESSGTESAEGLWGTIKTVFWAVSIALVVRTFAYEPFNIPSASMYPGLLIGDYLFVSKFTYGYSRYSIPWSPNVIDDRMLGSPPRRGDVAVFRLPRNPKIDYIKRVVGLPGDKIQVKEGRLHINGKMVERRLIDPNFAVVPGEPARRLYEENLPGARAPHRILEAGDNVGGADSTPEYTVPAGHYFMMGDNRDNSIDSRVLCTSDAATNENTMCVGFVPVRNFVGRAEFLFFSTDGSAELWEIWKWPGAIRWGRLFNGVR